MTQEMKVTSTQESVSLFSDRCKELLGDALALSELLEKIDANFQHGKIPARYALSSDDDDGDSSDSGGSS